MSRKIYPKAAYGLGSEKTEPVFNKNHFANVAAYPADVQEFIHRFDMHRVAGNIWECSSQRDFWQVKDGKIRKLVGSEVDDGDSIPAAPEEAPMSFISNMLDGLEF